MSFITSPYLLLQLFERTHSDGNGPAETSQTVHPHLANLLHTMGTLPTFINFGQTLQMEHLATGMHDEGLLLAADHALFLQAKWLRLILPVEFLSRGRTVLNLHFWILVIFLQFLAALATADVFDQEYQDGDEYSSQADRQS